MSSQPGGSKENVQTVLARVISLEHTVEALLDQQRAYVRQRESDLQLAAIEATLKRLDTDLAEAKKHAVDPASIERIERDLNEVRTQFDLLKNEVRTRLDTLKNEVNTQDVEVKQLQINVLKYLVLTIVGVFLTVGTGVLIGFILHQL